jgi:hypothetical protein
MSGKGGDALADGDSAAAPNHEFERVDGFKGRLATLCTHEAELDVELSELDVQHAIKLRELEAARLTLETAHKEALKHVKANARRCEQRSRWPRASLSQQSTHQLVEAATRPSGARRADVDDHADASVCDPVERCVRARVSEVGAADGELLDRSPQARRAVGGIRGGRE